MRCSTPGCQNQAVLQWSKQLDTNEVESHVGKLHQQLMDNAEEERLGLRFRIASVQEMMDRLPESLSSEDRRTLLARGERQKQQLQKMHEAVPTTFDLSHHREQPAPSDPEASSREIPFRALFACADHNHGDLDWYARMHRSDCPDTQDCGCS